MSRKYQRFKTIQHALEKTIKEYATSSSPHGIGYIFEARSSLTTKCFWFMIVGMAIILRYVGWMESYLPQLR